MNFAAIVFLAYLAINSGSSSSAWSGSSNYPSRNNYGDGEACDSCKRINELTRIAEDYANETRKSLQIIEQRMNSFEKTQASFQKILNNIEQIMNEMRGILHSTKNLDTEDKKNAKTKPSTINPLGSSTVVEENITTCPPCPAITKEKAKMVFDRVYKGKNVQLSDDLRTATRASPTVDQGYYVSVVSNSPLEEDEVFEIRIDETIDYMRDHGFGIGVIEEKNERIKDALALTWTNGTWAILSGSGPQWGISRTYKDGKVIAYDGYPMSTKHLPAGTRLGVSRRRNGNLHFYLNGVDKGPAFGDVPKDIYAFVDILFYVKKISIMN